MKSQSHACIFFKEPSRERSHIPPWEKENHLQNAFFGGYVSLLEGRYSIVWFCWNPKNPKWDVNQKLLSNLYWNIRKRNKILMETWWNTNILGRAHSWQIFGSPLYSSYTLGISWNVGLDYEDVHVSPPQCPWKKYPPQKKWMTSFPIGHFSVPGVCVMCYVSNRCFFFAAGYDVIPSSHELLGAGPLC